MKINRKLAGSVALACTALIGSASVAQNSNARVRLPPRNFILLIGDGMDDSQVTIARNYLVGAFGELNIDRLPQRGTAQVLTYEEELPIKVAYVADSANGGTSLATGGATSTGRIGTTIVEDKDLTNIVELAKAAGYKAGVVTTASVTDATPASFLSHVAFRSCEGPASMGPGPFGAGCPADTKAAGGKGSIAEQIADGNADVVLGGGTTVFGQTAELSGGKTVEQLAQANGFNVVKSKAALNAYSGGGRLLGLFSGSTMPVKWTGPATVRVTSAAQIPAPGNCVPNESNANPASNFSSVPSLAAMTQKAIDVLSKDNSKGFILVIESASVDKQAHSRNACGHIGEMDQLDEVAGMLRDLADQNPGTMLLVTSDHGQSPQLIDDAPALAPPGGGAPSFPIGNIVRINSGADDGAVLRISYATTSGSMENHTGISVPVFAVGGTPQNQVSGFLRQTEVFSIMKKHLLIK